MPSRQDLRDCLKDIILKAAEDHETDLALGNEVSAPLSGALEAARPTSPQLEKLLNEIKDLSELQHLVLKVDWAGSRDEGAQVIRITQPST